MSPTARKTHPAAKEQGARRMPGKQHHHPEGQRHQDDVRDRTRQVHRDRNRCPPAAARIVFSANAVPMAAAPRVAMTPSSHAVE